MPYPYNHIYSEAQVPPLPVGRPPSGPPPTMEGSAEYSNHVTKAANSPPVQTEIATFSNGVYSVEDSTIYAMRSSTSSPGQ